jgi:hypothetical protein
LRPLALTALAVALAAAPARADTVDACLRAADEGQALRDQGKLTEARERFLACSRDACPGMVRADCAGWLADVSARLPSVVLGAADGDGRDLVDVTVAVDGGPAEALTGRSRALDPGLHRFRFARPTGAAIEVTAVLREGERSRAVTARFGGPRPPPPAEAPRLSRPAVVAAAVLGGVAAAGGGLFAGLAVSAKNEVDHLRSTCAPNCQQAQVDAVRAKEIGANVALGVGIGAVVAAAVVLIVRPTGEPKAAWLGPGGVRIAF